MFEEVVKSLGENSQLIGLVIEAVQAGVSHDEMVKTIKQLMILASDREMKAELEHAPTKPD